MLHRDMAERRHRELAGWQDRAATSGKMKGREVCLFVNNSWCVMSDIKEVLRYCSPEIEYLIISCRPHYLPREFTSILFLAVYLSPQTDAGTKTALNDLYKAISKQENAHPEAALLVAGDFIAGKLKSVLPHFYQHVTCANRNTYKALLCPPFGKSDHNYILLIPAYKKKLNQEVPVTRSI